MLSRRSLSIVGHARAKVGEKVRDEVGRRVDAGKRSLTARSRKLVSRYLPDSGYARLEYGAILDGHTVNLSLIPPAESAGEGTRAWIDVVSRTSTRSVPAQLRRTRQGWRVECTFLLGERLGGLDLAAGRWNLDLRVEAPGGSPKTLPIRGANASHGTTGPTVAARSCPITGARHRLGLSPSGRARLDVLAPRASAELVDARLMLARGELTIDVVGASEAPAAVEAVCGEARMPCTPPSEQESAAPSGRIVAQIPLRDMSLAHQGAGRETRVWTFEVRLSGGGTLTVGRRLHGLRHPLRVLGTQEMLIAVRQGVLARARTGFTRRGTFELLLTPPAAALNRPPHRLPAPGKQTAS